MKCKIGIIICLIISLLTTGVYATSDLQVYKDLSNMVKNNWKEDFIGYIKFVIGENIMEVDGIKKYIDNNDSSIIASIIDGKSMLPIRAIAEEIGAKIDYDIKSQAVILKFDDIKITIGLKKQTIEVAGEEKEIDLLPVIENGKTYLPVRKIAEAFGMGVDWNSETKQVTLTNDLQMRRMIVKAKEKIDIKKYNSSSSVDLGDNTYVLQFNSIGKTQKAYDELKKDKLVESVELDKIASVGNSNLEQYARYRSWGASKMHVEEYKQYLNDNNKREEVVVAVIDSGITKEHQLFDGKIKEGGFNFWGGNTDLKDETNQSHGTHVAGIIVDITQNTNVKVLPIKVTNSEGKTSLVMLGTAIDYARKQGADLVNMSISFGGVNSVMTNAIKKAKEEDILIFAASGNSATNVDYILDKVPEPVYVGAIDCNNQIASFSCYGNQVDLVAPGVDVVSSLKNGYGYMSGTSMATPHVSAVAALYKIDNKNLTAKQLEDLIKNNVDDLGNPGKDMYYGVGIPNMLKALKGKDVLFCNQCGRLVNNIWEDDTKGSHIMKCSSNHIYKSEKHLDSDENLECDVCLVAITTCQNCNEKLLDGWQTDGGDFHYKKCLNGHASYKKVHSEPDEDGNCSFCEFRLLDDEEAGNEETSDEENSDEENSDDEVQLSGVKCSICNEDTYYKVDVTMHILTCVKDESHILIEDHKFSDMQCTECKYIDSKKYSSKFADYTDETHWAWRNVCNLVEKQIVKGASDTETHELKLYPDEKITAEAFIALVARILGYDGVDKLKNEELYVPIISSWSEGEWRFLMDYFDDKAKSTVEILLANNVVPEDEKEIATNYKKYITREKAAYLLGSLFDEKDYESFSKVDVDVTKKYEDWNEVSSTYRMRLALLTYYDILRGNLEEGKLYVDPKEKLTRVQAIALIDRYRAVRELFDKNN